MDTVRPNSSLIRVITAAALGGDIVVEPIKEGISTYVYRLVRDADAFYLRVLPEEGATFAPEVAAHMLLRRRGVQVPDVVYWEDLNHVVERSGMITTEIKGTAIGQGRAGVALPDMLRSAGRDLAVINRVLVDGFGWISRDMLGDQRLRATFRTEREFMLADLSHSLSVLENGPLGSREIAMIRRLACDHPELFDAPHACLAHGDFDVTHIYNHQGRYSGIIDLGEIRGTGPYYDLGHFHFQDGETLPATLLPYLLQGYEEVAPLPPDAGRRVAFDSLLIGVGFLARTHTRLAKRNLLHAITAIERDLKSLAT